MIGIQILDVTAIENAQSSILSQLYIRFLIFRFFSQLSLHYGAQNVRYIISDFRQKVSLRASLQRRQQPS